MTQICYLLQQDGQGLLVKIGVTANVKRRAKQICSGTPFSVRLHAIVDGGLTTEREFKETFQNLNVKGEWFRPAHSMNEWLQEKKATSKLLQQVETGPDYIEKYLVPVARSYLAGRDPLNNEPGDLVARLLAGALPDASARAYELTKATTGAITAEMAHGYIPNISESAFIPIILPVGLAVIEAA